MFLYFFLSFVLLLAAGTIRKVHNTRTTKSRDNTNGDSPTVPRRDPKACSIAESESSSEESVDEETKRAMNMLRNEDDMKVLKEVIRRRRSIFPKDMTGELVDEEDIKQLFEAANWAPTHGKTEPWRFVVLGKKAQVDFQHITLEFYEKNWEKYFSSHEAFLQFHKETTNEITGRWSTVSHMIAIGMKRQALPDKLMPEWEEFAACACAIQNMHLLAATLGLACYWSSWHDEARESSEIKSFLGLEDKDKCLGLFIVGKSNRMHKYKSRRGPIEKKVTWRE